MGGTLGFYSLQCSKALKAIKKRPFPSWQHNLQQTGRGWAGAGATGAGAHGWAASVRERGKLGHSEGAERP